MSDKGKHTKKYGPDLTVEETKEQLFGQHSDSVKRKVESNEFYRSAFEGLKSVPDAEAFDSAITDIQKNISKQSGYHTSQEIKLNRKKWMIAASIAFALITLGSVLFINLGNDNTLSENAVPIDAKKQNSSLEKSKKTPQIIPTDEQFDEEQITDEVPSSEGENAPVEVNEGRQDAAISNVNTPVESSLRAQQDEIPVAPPVEEKIEEDDALIAEESVDYYSNTTAPAVAEMNNLATRSAASVAEDVNTSNLESSINKPSNEPVNTTVTVESAMSLYNSGEYKAAIDQFDDLLKAYPGNRKANYYAGVSYMNIGKSTKAISHFDELINTGGSTYTDSSKWLKANILVKKGKKNDAKKLLEDLSQRQNRYSQEAKDLLQTL